MLDAYCYILCSVLRQIYAFAVTIKFQKDYILIKNTQVYVEEEWDVIKDYLYD